MKICRTAIIIAMLLLAAVLASCGSVPGEMPEPTIAPEIAQTPKPTPELTPEPAPSPLQPVELVDYCIDESMFEKAEEQGRVVTVDYETQDYCAGSSEPVTKHMTVYLPYGYDEQKQYDLLFLMHVMGCDENFWLRREITYPTHESGSNTMYLADMLDNMIEKGFCRPLIVVGLNGYLNYERMINHSYSNYEQFEREFSEDILPFMAENFGTYIEGTEQNEMRLARDHVGFIGASYGAYLNYLSIIGPNFDLVSHFGFSGGGEIDYSYLWNSWSETDSQDLPVNCLYIGEGEYDDRQKPELSYMRLMRETDKFSEDNLYFTLYKQTGHEDREWINSVYNCLQLFFR